MEMDRDLMGEPFDLNSEPDDKEMFRGCMVAMIVYIVLCLLLVLTGCSKTVYVPEYHTQYIVKTDSVETHDSIYVQDSVYIEKKADTVFIGKIRYIYRDKWRDRVVTDTLIRTDSITVVKEVPAKITRWQRIRMDLGTGAMIASVILLALWLVYKKFLR